MQRANYARGLRFLPIVAFITTVGVLSASAQNVYTDPVGFITLTAEGTAGPGSSPAKSFWGLGMTPVSVLRGQIGTVNGTQLPVNSTLTPGQYNAVAEGAQYYIEDLGSNGTAVGFTDDIISNDAANVYTTTDDHLEIISGDNFKIYPHWTMSSVFGATDQAGLQPASDSVTVPNPVTKGSATYVYESASKSVTAGWKNVLNGADANSVPLYQDQGLLISRTATTNLLVQLVGGVKVGTTIIPLDGPGANFAANVYASSAITLSTSHLYTDGNSTDSVVAAIDSVAVHNDATGVLSTYVYENASKSVTAGWKNVLNGADASNVAIPLGANILINLGTGHPGFNWNLPAPY